MTIRSITVTRAVEALLEQGEEVESEETLNEDASVERWVELLQARLEEQFQGADIRVRTRRAARAELDIAVQADGREEERSARQTVRHIAEELAEGEEWIVPEVGG